MLSIGFDAKRAFLNQTGLGNYSRTLIQSLVKYAPQHRYVLYTPSDRLQPDFGDEVAVRMPGSFLGKKGTALWRSRGLLPDLKKEEVQLYHGLSNELPFGLKKAGIASVATIHDLIFLQEPEGYKAIDRIIYQKKLDHVLDTADHIVAISEATREAILNYRLVDEERVSVLYQSCDSDFRRTLTQGALFELEQKYNLPHDFVLHIGGWNIRKNLHGLIEAVLSLPKTLRPPLVALGAEPRALAPGVDIIYLNNLKKNELPALFQLAHTVVYPSLREGFGLPVLEALSSGTPVLTSKKTSMEEIAQDAAIYVNPGDPVEIANGLRQILLDSDLRDSLITAGRVRAAWFSPKRIASHWTTLYERLVG
jgi:glycosyltransferase involved in cell wall biosynthesis